MNLIYKTMAQLQLQPASTGKRNRYTKSALRIDMTPMVDLGFLLITFFIFTTTVSEPTVTKLYMPADGDGTNIAESNAVTVLLADKDKIYCYEGKWQDALRNHKIVTTNYQMHTGLGKIIRDKQASLGGNKEALMLLIKPSAQSSYKNVIDALDETMINDLGRYAIVDPSEQEIAYVNAQEK